jgi:type I restriction enzyme R subunit
MTPPPPRDEPEKQARRTIDAMLRAAGWVVQDRKEIDLSAAPGVAVREFQTKAGPADYLLFLGNHLVGVIEAKKEGVNLAAIEAQTREYAAKAPTALQVPIRPLPFLYESTGVRTFFTNGLDPDACARSVFTFHRPDVLRDWLTAELERRQGKPDAKPSPTVKGRMRRAPPLNTAGMWPAQVRAIVNLEESIRNGRPRALIQMATGAGKTFTAISALYRLINEGGARRVLFLVDRGNLGRQAHKEFQAFTTPDDGRKFTELYNVVNLTHNKIDSVNKVVITTIQRLFSILKGEETFDEELEESSAHVGAPTLREPPTVVYNHWLPPDFFDVVVIDECHRSIYSTWQPVLEYFDATLIGLTATPERRTFAFFHKNVVSEYPHEHAVRDKVNVPYQVYEIRTRIGTEGAVLKAEADTVVGKRHRQTKATRWELLDEDLTYGTGQLDRSVVAVDQIRTTLRAIKERMFTEIFPGREVWPKTLVFAKSDDHAEDVLRILREEWHLSNEKAVKITYKPERAMGDAKRKSASHKPDELIQAFRNSPDPRVAVTVDMIATGTDIKPLECVIFLRAVKSRVLFDQMIGRGVRVMPDADFQAVTPGGTTKTHFVVIDCVGAMEDTKSEPPLDRQRSVHLSKLLELVAAGNRDEDVLSTIAARLDRMDRQLTPDQRALIEGASGGVPLRALVAQIIDRIDPDVEDARARELFNLAPGADPTEEQVKAAQAKLREEAAAPLAYSHVLRTALLEVRKEQDVTIDTLSLDEVIRAGARPDLQLDYDADKALVGDFSAFCEKHRNEIDALMVLYQQPHRQRLTRKQLMELLAAIKRPPYQWTSEALWAAYERLEKGRVRGASRGRLLTDLISLARHAMGVDAELVSYADQADTRFQNWLMQQQNRGRTFTEEQRGWLELIRDRIVVDLEVRMEDLDDTPFAERGGLGKVWSLFGEDLEVIVAELNRELVA